MAQKILNTNGEYSILDSWFKQANCCLLVCGKSITRLKINDYLDEIPSRLGVKIFRFMDFQPNPLYESVIEGTRIFREKQCDAIIAIGGGSAIDVAKCIKLYSNLSGNGEAGSWLNMTIVPNEIPFLVMPTTAGTGSESTKYAVIYYKGNKQSVTSESFIPETILMDSSVLKTLPLYHKKATMMDALSHAIESFWSVNSTEVSKEYSKTAIKNVLKHIDGYLSNTEDGNSGMLMAAHLAGQAINITQTTAGHAMCYKITSLFGTAHGHAAILCNRILFEWMIDNTEKCIDPRGENYLKETFNEIGLALGCNNGKEGAAKLKTVFKKLELQIPMASANHYEELTASVDPSRLKNHPIQLTPDIITELYHKILR